VLLVIDASQEEAPQAKESARLSLGQQRDPLEPLFRQVGEERLGAPDLAGAARMPARARRQAMTAIRDETRRALLGYDANAKRAMRLAEFLETPLPKDLGEAFRQELALIREELATLADVGALFIRSPRASVSGELGPSNNARLRMYVRRIRAAGAGLAGEFLDVLRRALAHYGISSLEPSDALERAVLRLLASQQIPALRDRLALAMLQRVTALARAGVHLADDRRLEAALDQIAGMRGLLNHAVADAAVEAHYVIFERPQIERLAERTNKEVQVWLALAETRPTAPPEEVLLHLADAPRTVFDRVGHWIADPDPRRRAIALAAHLRRIYSPLAPVAQASFREGEQWIERMELPGSRIVLAGACAAGAALQTAELLVQAALAGRESHEWPAVHAIELFAEEQGLGASDPGPALRGILAGSLSTGRFTLTRVRSGKSNLHQSFIPSVDGFREDVSTYGLHPEAASRVDLDRLQRFDVERIPGPEGIYCFQGRAMDESGDERIFVLADLRSRSPDDGREAALHVAAFEHTFYEATRALRNILAERDPKRRLQWNRISIYVAPEIFLDAEMAERLSRRLAPATRNLGLEKVVVRLRLLDREEPEAPAREMEIVISDVTGTNMTILSRSPRRAPLAPRSAYERKVAEARRRRLVYPYEIIRMLTGAGGTREAADPEARLAASAFQEYDLDPQGAGARAVARPFGLNESGIVFGVITTPTEKVPEGMKRVMLLSDPTRGMGALSKPECDRVVAALDLADALGVPVEWLPVSSGARIAMDSGTENLDATARVVRRIIEFTQAGGSIHLIVAGVNVGAQSYWDALATMGMHCKGALIMTPNASMVLTGRAALEASGSVSAEDEQAIGGFERIMGANGEAQYQAKDISDAYRILYEHYRYTYVVPGEAGPRPLPQPVLPGHSVVAQACSESEEFQRVGEIFDAETNPGRKRPFPMRAVMQAVIDPEGGHLERWRAWVGAETAIVWDAHLGGRPVCLIGIESQNVPREGYRPFDGPGSWTGGTLFPLSSKKLARALHAASGIRPAVILANLSGFDGSPESMRKLQLEYGAEIARAVVNFEGPILFLVVSRYHGGAYVVFSRALNPRLRVAALRGSFASVIGGGPAAAVVFGREVRARAAEDPRVRALRGLAGSSDEARAKFQHTLGEVTLEKQTELADEFDAIHTVERARRVGSLEEIVEPEEMRSWLVRVLEEEGAA